MQINKNSRQMPTSALVVQAKEYCDLLYAWFQCESERCGINEPGRRVPKSKASCLAIERAFTRQTSDGTVEKVMARKTIKKYLDYLIEVGLIEPRDDGYYYLTVLSADGAHLIEYRTLNKLMNVFRKNSISIYIYLFNRYYANGCGSFIVTMKQIKDYIGIATSTTSNNMIVDDTLEVLKRLGLLQYHMTYDGPKSMIQIDWVRNELPDLKD